MLVISRKIGESLIVSDHIKITIVACGNDKVSIGIDAPKEVRIIREELLETIEANKASIHEINNDHYKYMANLIKNKKNY